MHAVDALSSGILPDMREFLAALRLAEQSEIGAFPEEGSTDVIERLIELDAFAYTGRRAGVSGDLGERLRGSGEPVPFAQTPPPLPYRSPYRFPYCSLNVCFIGGIRADLHARPEGRRDGERPPFPSLVLSGHAASLSPY